MDKITNEDIKVFGRVVSVSTEGVVADSEQLWDSNLKKKQSELNQAFQLGLKNKDINVDDLRNAIIALQNRVTTLEERLNFYINGSAAA